MLPSIYMFTWYNKRNQADLILLNRFIICMWRYMSPNHGVSLVFFLNWLMVTVEAVPDNLTHWGRVTLICVSKLTIIGSDNGLSPGRRQAIIWTNAGILLIRPTETKLYLIHTFTFNKSHLKMSSGKWWPSCLGLNELKHVEYALAGGIHMKLNSVVPNWISPITQVQKLHYEILLYNFHGVASQIAWHKFMIYYHLVIQSTLHISLWVCSRHSIH